MAGGADTVANVNIKFPITFSILNVIAVLIVTFIYWLVSKSPTETLVFFAAVSAAAGQITVSFYTARLLSSTIAHDRAASEREKRIEERERRLDEREENAEKFRAKQAAMAFGSRWNDPAMFHVRDTAREVVRNSGTEEELQTYVESRATNVIHVLNFLEEIRTAHRHQLADREVLKEQFDGIVVSTWMKLHGWINKHRTSTGNRDTWEDLENLYDAWKRKQ
jgi:hypothetical protein